MKKFLLPIILLLILSLCLGTAHASGDLDNMSLEELQKLQEQLNRKISEKEKEAGLEPPAETAPPAAEAVPIKALKISAPKTPLAKGGETPLAPLVTVTPAEASKDGLQYTVSDESIAAVTSGGNLAGKKAGTVTVTVTDPAGGKKASVKIQVVTLVEDMEVTPRYPELFVGKTVRLTAGIQPEDASNKKVVWESEHPEIAKVAANGTVTGVAPGSTYIYARSQDGSFTVALARVTVTVPVRRITPTLREKAFFTGDVLKTDYKVEPENATNQNIDWVSSDPYVAEVNSYGTVSAKNPGKCTITGTAKDGGGATAKFTVYVDSICPVHLAGMSYKSTRNGRSYSFDVVSDCAYRKVKGFNFELRCYDEGDNIPTLSAFYTERRIDPGKKAATKWSNVSTPGLDTASKVVVIVTDVFFTDGSSIKIPENERIEITYTLGD